MLHKRDSKLERRSTQVDERSGDEPPLKEVVRLEECLLTARSTAMARKRYKPEEIVSKLRQVEVLISHGQTMADAIRQIGVNEVTYYRSFGGLKTEQVKRLKDLELENSRCARWSLI
jgi:hypothetical protein